MSDLNVNFNFVASAQSLEAKTNEVAVIGEDFARLIVNEVALAASKDSFQRARTRFVSSVKQVIRAEVSRMATLIGRFLPLPDKYSGPNGQMSLGGLSATAERFGFPETFNRSEANIQWAKRSKKYLAWKDRNNLPAKWWAAHGDLQKGLMAKKTDFYEEAFGPIRVRLERPAPGRNEKGQFVRTNSLPRMAVNPAFGATGKAVSGRINITAPSSRGKVSAQVSVGTLKVDVFGKITPAMLPGLAGARWNPKQSEPTSGEGVVGLFPDDGPGGIRNKLLGTSAGRHYRYAVEPFVAFFLMRSIPNAVWRRTETMIRGSVEANVNKTGLGNQFS